MVTVLALAAAVAQAPQVSATVDRAEALVGDIITLTIRVEARGDEAIRVVNPLLSGLEVRGSREATQVRIQGADALRTYTRELRLAATVVGTATIGPVRVRQGDAVAETATITVAVAEPAAGVAPSLAPLVRAVVDTASPPGTAGDNVSVQVIAVPGRVVLGAQFDLLTLAWFPRTVRSQLRTPPTLAPPEIEGVWSYRQNTPSGIVASKRVSGRWYDLFVNHQVLFPLTPGRVHVGPATVSYVLPLTYSFLSRELQHEVKSDTLSLAVAPQPTRGRPPGFVGAAGSEITLDFAMSPPNLRPGGAATATVAIEGIGNVSLWPEPDVAWPRGLRVYPGEVTVDLAPRGGRVAGRKQFTYLVVPDTAGTHAVPVVRYDYFDPLRGRYERASATGAEVVAALATVPRAARTTSLPLMQLDDATWVTTPLDRVPVLAWVLLFLAAPLLLLIRIPRRRAHPRREAPPSVSRAEQGELERLDHEFRSALTRLVPDARQRAGPGLASALRAAGLDAFVAAHALRIRDRLQGAVFGPAGATDTDELAAEVREVLRALGEARPEGRARLVGLAMLTLASVMPMQGMAQGPAAERLYEAGAMRAAADSFLARALTEPRATAHWYNLGSALFQLGEDARARVAWTRAARLAPRDPAVRRALALLPGDPITDDLIRVRRATVGEIALVAIILWAAGWLLLAFRRSRRVAWALVGVGALCAVAALQVRAEARRAVAVTLGDNVPLREAPYGAAPAARTLLEGAAVVIERRPGLWVLVRRGDARGWLLRTELALL